MVKALFLLFCVLFISSLNAQRVCKLAPSKWGECMDGILSRTVICLCDDVEEDISECDDLEPPLLTHECEVEAPICKWKWTRWTTCTEECSGGNTTRTQVCLCEGEDSVADDAFCDPLLHYGQEIADCNTFACDEVPAFNKLYWIERAEEGHWPMPDDTFECSLGYDVNTSTPKGKHYSTILREYEPQNKPHPEWYYLAKEWITAKLNIANGVKMSSSSIELISSVSKILDDCNGWTGRMLYDVYSAKEKLGRMNNNIGGLDHVDEQVAVLAKGNGVNYGDDLTSSRTMALVITIPAIAIVAVLMVVGVIIYYRRKNTYAVVDKAEFDSEDEGEATQNPINENIEHKTD